MEPKHNNSPPQAAPAFRTLRPGRLAQCEPVRVRSTDASTRLAGEPGQGELRPSAAWPGSGE